MGNGASAYRMHFAFVTRLCKTLSAEPSNRYLNDTDTGFFSNSESAISGRQSTQTD